MTAVRARRAIVELDDAALPELVALLDCDPLVNAPVSARIDITRTLVAPRLGGFVGGVRDAESGRLLGACYNGGNLIPLGGDPATWDVLADWVASGPQSCTAITGRADAVAVMWQRLEREWGPARDVRLRQPLLVADRPPAVPVDARVRPAQLRDFDAYLAAAASMFAAELGVAPSVTPGEAAFRARVVDLIRRRRAFARFDERGRVEFKAELGAVSRHTAQVQGVWVRPDLRGRGLGTAGLAAVVAVALRLAPSVSLYVNDFNTAALRMYERLGMRTVATLSTVLLP